MRPFYFFSLHPFVLSPTSERCIPLPPPIPFVPSSLATSPPPPPSASFVGHVAKPHMADLCLVLLVVADNGEDSETAADLEDARCVCVLLLVLRVDFF